MDLITVQLLGAKGPLNIALFVCISVMFVIFDDSLLGERLSLHGAFVRSLMFVTYLIPYDNNHFPRSFSQEELEQGAEPGDNARVARQLMVGWGGKAWEYYASAILQGKPLEGRSWDIFPQGGKGGI